MASRRIHVVPHNGQWAVRRENTDRVSSQHKTQQAATNAAKRTAQDVRGEVVIHRSNGEIRDSDSYGNDSCPPRDRKH